MIAIIVISLLPVVFIAAPLLYDYLRERKQESITESGLKEELEFIQNYKSSHEATGKYTTTYSWEFYNGYKNNRICPYSCFSCDYWVELDDGLPFEFRRGICKLQYKQWHNAALSNTYHDWYCDYHSFNKIIIKGRKEK